MRILIDIGHPAHVHYFKNLIKEMEKRGHGFLIIAKNKSVTLELLDYYQIKYITRKNYPRHILGKLLYIPFTDLFILKNTLEFKPDILMGISGTHIAHVGFLTGTPSIVIDDTDHATLAHASYKYFAKHILTPTFFSREMGDKQIRFDSYLELCALHPDHFVPDPKIRLQLGLELDEKFIILRFVSWSASHDIGHNGLTVEMKRKVINHFKQKYKIFISSEGELPKEFMQYKLNVPPYMLHHVLNYASLYIGEGSTTASECSVLGTPAIYCNSLIVSYCKEQEEKYSICFQITNIDEIIAKAEELLAIKDKNAFNNIAHNIIQDKINPTKFFMWFLENYPDSATIMKEEPEYQYRFV